MRKIILALLLLFTFNSPANTEAGIPRPISRIPDSDFTEIAVPIVKEIKDVPHHYIPYTKPAIRIPDRASIAISSGEKRATKNVRTGWASYYCLRGKSRCTIGHSGGMYAAIRKDLLFLRGKTVQVCKYKSHKCIYVRIIDCNCGPNANLIDLYSDAFRKLIDLSRGKVKVTIKW